MTKKQRKQKKKLQTHNRKLIAKYPWLLPRSAWTGKPLKNYDYTYIEWGWSPGWDKAFGKMFMEELGEAIKEAGLEHNYRILQIKEKYGCYDKETEVLTKAGWKYFKDLSYEDEIATLNPQTEYLEYQRPSEIIAEKYKGQMYRLENRGISLCVTPNHNLYVAKGSYFNGVKNNYKRYYDFELCNPEKYFRKDKRFKKTCKWKGKLYDDVYKIKGIEYDSVFSNKDENPLIRHYVQKDLTFNMIAWLRFLGFYVAEGCAVNKANMLRRCEINVSFNPYDEVELVTELIQGIGFEPKLDTRGNAKFCSITLAEWLYKNCGDGALNKKVPDFIKTLPSFYIEEFLKYLYIGDGHKNPTSNILVTISKQLSDDVQELLLKCGYSFRETIRDRRGQHGYVNGSPIISRYISYDINWLQLPDIEIDMSKAKKTDSYIEEWIKYSGMVYCVTVPNHIIYIRRNGKGVWCGNSARLYDNGGTEKTHKIITKYEILSQNCCWDCGKPAPPINDGWITPRCFKCFIKNYRHREKYYINYFENYTPKTDQELEDMYNKFACEKPAEDGKYHYPTSYMSIHYTKNEKTTEEIDISETTAKLERKMC